MFIPDGGKLLLFFGLESFLDSSKMVHRLICAFYLCEVIDGVCNQGSIKNYLCYYEGKTWYVRLHPEPTWGEPFSGIGVLVLCIDIDH